MNDKVDVASIQKKFVDHGIWLRPFSNLIYIMPPYIISQKDLKFLINQLDCYKFRVLIFIILKETNFIMSAVISLFFLNLRYIFAP
jgi:hypothetical protein